MMWNWYDVAYGVAVGVSAPVWGARRRTREKVRAAFAERMGRVERRAGEGVGVLIHAVSLGEINATRGLVRRLREVRGDVHVIVSATTQTGWDRAQELYGKEVEAGTATLIRYPLDFTGAVSRVLEGLRPAVAVLMELEVWPNFLLQCEKRGIPVVLVNGRVTEPSFRRYAWGGMIVRRMFHRISALCVQEQTYADRFRILGAPADRIHVTGTMKFDTATVAERVAGDEDLAREVGLRPGALGMGEERVWVCGSTGPGEEEMILTVYAELREVYRGLRLVVVPRKPERFDEVAELIAKRGFGVVRRSATRDGTPAEAGGEAVILGDTMGELRKFYSLADVVLVGRTMVDLGPRQHGSDMIEPAALGKPVIVGPYTGNFADVMGSLRRGEAVEEVRSALELTHRLKALLQFPGSAKAMGKRAQEVVEQGKGATEKHVRVILEQLERVAPAK